ncbi:MAG: AmmeMemoRadiSam system protein B, partial [Pseudomonadota bacterium]
MIRRMGWLAAAVLLLAWAAAPSPGLAGGVREPAVAGIFYSSDPGELEEIIREYLEKAPRPYLNGPVKALISPHAGYRFSGFVAAAGYRRVPRDVKRVLILAPSHHAAFVGVSIPDVDAYRTPLGLVPLDPEAKRLAGLPGFGYVPEAHAAEHSLEVQLPFLQKALGDFTLIPLVLGQVDPEELARTLLPLADQGVFFIASSDLSHYHDYKEAKKLDAVCTMAMSRFMFHYMDLCEACGKTPVTVLMHIAREKGWTGRVLDAANTADTWGPMAQVVGYASIAYVEDQGEDPMREAKTPEKDRQALLTLARSAIRAKLFPDAQVIRPEPVPESLGENRGCFVTLHVDGQLKGCIGTIEPLQSLVEGVEFNAVNAAFQDPRFSPLSVEEFPNIKIEISVLTVPRPLPFTDGADLKEKLKPGVHGVILSRGMRRSTFLPQVWEQVPDTDTFLTMLCRKGSMAANCWQDPETRVLVYEAEYFEEE